MDIIRATEIIRALADGIDPLTGEILPVDSICDQVDVVRAFHCVLTALEHPESAKEQGQESRKASNSAEKCRMNILRQVWKQDVAGSNPITQTTL